MTRPPVLLSVAVSVDGYLDDTSPDRLRLSDAADFDRVDQVRADSDAILVGAQTCTGTTRGCLSTAPTAGPRMSRRANRSIHSR
ncbi:dihydrofolate reductase family protein [Nocardia sp. 2YAB30]|uniref:dihydrofolate reductase family protein n=1 Tax=Nocardia sp. 2YAB30 TaxID=3233022 RepID=UPI003F950035